MSLERAAALAVAASQLQVARNEHKHSELRVTAGGVDHQELLLRGRQGEEGASRLPAGEWDRTHPAADVRVQLCSLYQEGKIVPETSVWYKSLGPKWMRLQENIPLYDAIKSAKVSIAMTTSSVLTSLLLLFYHAPLHSSSSFSPTFSPAFSPVPRYPCPQSSLTLSLLTIPLVSLFSVFPLGSSLLPGISWSPWISTSQRRLLPPGYSSGGEESFDIGTTLSAQACLFLLLPVRWALPPCLPPVGMRVSNQLRSKRRAYRRNVREGARGLRMKLLSRSMSRRTSRHGSDSRGTTE